MEKTFAKVEELADNFKEYVNTRIDAVKLGAAEKSSVVIANVAAGLIAGLVFLFFLGFASFALALFLGDVLGKQWAGFLIVAGVYLVAAIIVWTARAKIIQVPVMNALIHQLFRNDTEDEED
jgi:hypothetical protein